MAPLGRRSADANKRRVVMKNCFRAENVWLRLLCRKSWLPESLRGRSLKLFCSLITKNRRARGPNLQGKGSKKGNGSVMMARSAPVLGRSKLQLEQHVWNYLVACGLPDVAAPGTGALREKRFPSLTSQG